MVSSCQIMGYISVMLHRRLSQNHQAIELDICRKNFGSGHISYGVTAKYYKV